MYTPNYQKIRVWRKSRELSVIIYKITADFPKSEQFGLVSQMRRSAVSVPSNIAEGYMRKSSADFKRFLGISLGSLVELETQALIAKDLNYVKEDDVTRLFSEIESVFRMLTVFQKKI